MHVMTYACHLAYSRQVQISMKTVMDQQIPAFDIDTNSDRSDAFSYSILPQTDPGRNVKHPINTLFSNDFLEI